MTYNSRTGDPAPSSGTHMYMHANIHTHKIDYMILQIDTEGKHLTKSSPREWLKTEKTGSGGELWLKENLLKYFI